MEYTREALFDRLGKLSITRVGDTVITEFGGRVICTVNVSQRYEVFDIVNYIKNKIDQIEAHFNITDFELYIKGGRQSLLLKSESVEISGRSFIKTFHISNSTDRSRKLSFDTGLIDVERGYYIVHAMNNVSLCKRHIRGLNVQAEDASQGIGQETFDDQISALRELEGHQVAYSKIRQTILGDSDDVPQIAHKRMNMFNQSLRWHSRNSGVNVSSQEILHKRSEYLKELPQDKDFFIDAMDVIMCYLTIFAKEDSYTVKSESERIMKITRWAVRNDMLAILGI